MPTYELAFAVRSVAQSVADELIHDYDAVITNEHGGRHVVALAMEGGDGLDAARRAMSALRSRGLTLLRMPEDLVTRADIAERLGVTRQAVGLWARGERKRERAFPPPAHAVAGGLWLWSDVAVWAERNLDPDGPQTYYPSQAVHDIVNADLAHTLV